MAYYALYNCFHESRDVLPVTVIFSKKVLIKMLIGDFMHKLLHVFFRYMIKVLKCLFTIIYVNIIVNLIVLIH